MGGRKAALTKSWFQYFQAVERGYLMAVAFQLVFFLPVSAFENISELLSTSGIYEAASFSFSFSKDRLSSKCW